MTTDHFYQLKASAFSRVFFLSLLLLLSVAIFLPAQSGAGLAGGDESAKRPLFSPGYNGQLWIEEPGETVDMPFELDDSGRLVITTTGPSDTVLSVQDANGRTVALNDDYGEGLNSRVVLDVESGEPYTVSVHLYSSHTTGPFGLELSELIDTSDDDFGGRNDPGAHTIGTVAKAMFDYTGDIDAFAFTPAEDGVYRLETHGSLDTVMVLVDAAGRVVMEADDTAVGLNAAIETELVGGDEYIALVRAYSDDTLGPYQFSSSAIQSDRQIAASPQAELGTVYAVIVGAADYGGSGDLEGTLTDSYNMYRYAHQVLGAERENTVFMQDQLGRFDDTLSSDTVMEALEEVSRQAGEEDTIFFYYSGHGVEENGAFLLSLPEGQISEEDLLSALDTGTAGHTVLIFDSCNSGGFGESLSAPDRSIIAASTSDQFSYISEALSSERTRGSIFTSWFLDHLLYTEEPLTMSEAFKRTRQSLRLVGAEQTPELYSDSDEMRLR